jgi:restriction system protein
MLTMPLPTYDAIMLPLLTELADGKEHANHELRETVAAALKLTETERTERSADGRQLVLVNRFSWAKIHLDKAGLVSSPRRGWCLITEAGKKVLAEKPDHLDRQFLIKFPSYKAFVTHSEPGEDTKLAEPGAGVSHATPEEALEHAYLEIRKKVETDLLDAVGKASPGFFEKLVVELLVKMGYGGTLEDAGRALGRSHDGGVDGIIKEDHLGLDAIYVQAKRWQNNVGRPELQSFSGSLDSEHARRACSSPRPRSRRRPGST